jgi:hypothetical protein
MTRLGSRLGTTSQPAARPAQIGCSVLKPDLSLRSVSPCKGTIPTRMRYGLRVSSHRTIARRYAVPGGPFVVINYRQEPHRWCVTRPDTLGRLRRAILPPFRSYGAAVLAAIQLVGDTARGPD